MKFRIVRMDIAASPVQNAVAPSSTAVGPSGSVWGLGGQRSVSSVAKPRGLSATFPGSAFVPLPAWCEARSIGRPQGVTKPILERYQRHLFHMRKADGKPL